MKLYDTLQELETNKVTEREVNSSPEKEKIFIEIFSWQLYHFNGTLDEPLRLAVRKIYC